MQPRKTSASSKCRATEQEETSTETIPSLSFLITLASAAKRFGVLRVVWLCTSEIIRRLYISGGSGGAEIAIEVLCGATSCNLESMEKMCRTFIHTNYDKLVVSQAGIWVDRLSFYQRNDLLSEILQLGSPSFAQRMIKELPDEGPLPFDSIDKALRLLFRSIKVNHAGVAEVDDIGCDGKNGMEPDVRIETTAGFSFLVHAAVLRARSNFFQKALSWQSSLNSTSKAKYSILLTEDEYVNVCPPSVDVFMQ